MVQNMRDALLMYAMDCCISLFARVVNIRMHMKAYSTGVAFYSCIRLVQCIVYIVTSCWQYYVPFAVLVKEETPY